MIKELINFCHINGGEKITAPVAQENIGSNAVLKKLNFYVENEGTFKKCGTDIIYDEYTYMLDLEPRQQFNDNRVYYQVYDKNRKHRTKVKNRKRLAYK